MPRSPAAVLALTGAALIGFAANSLLCRAALGAGTIDAASFTAIRIASGAAVLWLLARGSARGAGSWWSGVALFAYAAAFSFAYLRLTTATGALILFAAVQASMIGYGVARVIGLARSNGSGSRSPPRVSSSSCCRASPHRIRSARC